MVNLEEARKMAAAARRAVLTQPAPRNVKVALMVNALIKLDAELTRISGAIEKHEDDCPWFRGCCRDAVKPACPAIPLTTSTTPGGNA